MCWQGSSFPGCGSVWSHPVVIEAAGIAREQVGKHGPMVWAGAQGCPVDTLRSSNSVQEGSSMIQKSAGKG